VILDAAGNEIGRHGTPGFLGEPNVLCGQTVLAAARSKVQLIRKRHKRPQMTNRQLKKPRFETSSALPKAGASPQTPRECSAPDASGATQRTSLRP
jgi:hypothetical protein